MSNNAASIPVKPCYSHIGGRLGALLMEQFIGNGWIKRQGEDDRHYVMTTKGAAGFTELGIDLSLIPKEIKQ
jgi:hypothetical protein